MKKVILSLALLLFVGNMTVQAQDKAAEKAAKEALKAAQKQAKADIAEATKMKEALYAKINDKSVTPEEILAECPKGSALVMKAIKSGGVDEKKISEVWKLLAEFTQPLHNEYLANATNSMAFDTLGYYNNLKTMTDALHNELKTTKVVKGEYGNEAALKAKNLNLGQSALYYIYAAQFENECKRYENALEAYDIAMSYAEKYPECAEHVKLPITNEQIAYYAFMTAHEGGKFDLMDKYYEKALGFADGAQGVKQVKLQTYLEKGDTTGWANAVHAECIAKPSENEDYIQMLLAYHQKSGVDAMAKFADEILAVDNNILIANYGKAYTLFATEKYDDALTYYKKCTEIKDDYYDAWYQCGLCKFRQALALNSTISGIKNQKVAKETLEKTKSIFAEAIPFFEKARQLTPDEPQKWAYELKQCYTVTGQAAKAAEMDKLL